jgi:hypothetical protein
MVFRGTQRPATTHTIFYEQLIAQLIIWNQTDLNTMLLGDINENIYTGQIAKRLALPDLMLSKQCLECMGMHVPPIFRDGIVPIDAILPLLELNASMHTSYPIKVEWMITGVSSLILRHHLLLVQNSPILSAALQGSYTVNPNGWSNHIMQS